MSKKNSINLLYLIGMIAVVVGCFLPTFGSKFFSFKGATCWDRIVSDGSGAVRVGSILAFAGAVAGIVFTLIKTGNGKLLKLISWIVSVAGAAWVIIDWFTRSDAARQIGKFFAKGYGLQPGVGLIIMAAGWVVAFIGWITKE